MGKDSFGYVNMLSSVFRAQEEQALKSCDGRIHLYSGLMHFLCAGFCVGTSENTFFQSLSSPTLLSMLMKSREKKLSPYFPDDMYLPPRKVVQ